MSRITVSILGTSAGIPTVSRGHSAVHLRYRCAEELSVLFDCGEGAQRQLMKAGLNYMRIDHIFITHWHGDHCLGLAGLIDTMGLEGREKELSVYSPESGMLERTLAMTHSAPGFKIIGHIAPHEGEFPVRLFGDDSVEVSSVPAEHGVPAVSFVFQERPRTVIDPAKLRELGLPDKSEAYGALKETGSAVHGGQRIRLEDVARSIKGRKIVYSGDTEISERLREIADGADLLIQDCTYLERPDEDKRHRHASLPEVVEMCRGIKVRKVLLTHISRKHEGEDLERYVPGEGIFAFAEDFMELDI